MPQRNSGGLAAGDPAPPARLLLTSTEAAERLSMRRETFLALHQAGKVPAPTMGEGRMRRWSADELEAWARHGCPPRHLWVDLWEGVRRGA